MHQQRKHHKVKTQVQQESPHKQERANLEHPVKEIRDHTTEPHRIPTIEVHPTKTASKMKHQEGQKQIKRLT